MGSASASFAGSWSKSNSSTRTAASGITTVISPSLRLTPSNACRNALATAARSLKLGVCNPAASTPGRKGANAETISCSASPGRPATTPALVISHARRGRSALGSDGKMRMAMLESMSLAEGLDKGDLVDFLKCSQAPAGTIYRRFAKKLHAPLLRQFTHLGGRLLLQNDFPDGIGQLQQFVDGGPSAITGPGTFNAARTFMKVEA